MERQIILELYRTLVLLGADFSLLGTVASWKDSLPDENVLSGLRAINEAMLTELKGRIEHCGISSPHQACNIHKGH